MIPEWTNKYIEIPFLEHGRTPDGVDCWGLIRLVYELELGIDIPNYGNEYDSTDDLCGIDSAVEHERGDWYEYPIGSEKLGDVILFAIRGANRHVGLVVGDGYMLHILKGTEVTLEKYKSPKWKNRVAGIYRHKRMLDWNCTDIPWDDGAAVEYGLTSQTY